VTAQKGLPAPAILLCGPNGQLGWELVRALATLGNVRACGREQLDLADSESIRRVVRETRPALIVNAAAYTAVDDAESEPDLAMAVNGTAPGVLAQEAQRVGAAFIHYSTDYVFDGLAKRPYREEDTPNPRNAYGRSKLAGEQAVLQVGGPALILRTGWVYGRRGKNFLTTITRLASERDHLDVVDDQIAAPTWCRLLADATAQILAPGIRDFAEHIGMHSGIYHMTCAGTTSWYGFACRILSLLNDGDSHDVTVNAITSSSYPTAAARPAYTVLDNHRLHAAFGVRLPDWEHALQLALAEQWRTDESASPH